MNDFSTSQIQEISYDFRSIARRLIRTDHSQCDANLKRFINYVDNNDLIRDFIVQHNTVDYDIENIKSNRDWLDPFEISADRDEEISLEYKLLKYATENYDGDFTRLYGTYYYTSAKSTVNDEMNKFIEHIIDPLINYISDHIHKLFVMAQEKEQSNVSTASGITANNSTVVVANTIEGNISNQVLIEDSTKSESLDLLKTIRESVDDSNENFEDILELIEQIEIDINANKKPQKGFLSALKTLCNGVTAVIPLITTLLKMFY